MVFGRGGLGSPGSPLQALSARPIALSGNQFVHVDAVFFHAMPDGHPGNTTFAFYCNK